MKFIFWSSNQISNSIFYEISKQTYKFNFNNKIVWNLPYLLYNFNFYINEIIHKFQMKFQIFVFYTTPLHLAIENGNQQISSLLINHQGIEKAKDEISTIIFNKIIIRIK